MLTLTDSAVKHLQDLIREKSADGKALRISVERGGCAGMSSGWNWKGSRSGRRVFSRKGKMAHCRP